MLDLEDATQLCVSIRQTVSGSPSVRADCRMLGRFVGRTQLILEALAELPDRHVSDGAPALARVKEALWGAAELVETVGRMGALQAVLRSAENGARTSAAAGDLADAVELLARAGTVARSLPPDVARDLEWVPRGLREAAWWALGSGGRARGASGGVLADPGGPSLSSSPPLDDDALSARFLADLALLRLGLGSREAVEEALGQALRAARLDPQRSHAWLRSEMAALEVAIADARRNRRRVAEFFFKQVLVCLVAGLTGAWHWVPGSPNAGTATVHGDGPSGTPFQPIAFTDIAASKSAALTDAVPSRPRAPTDAISSRPAALPVGDGPLLDVSATGTGVGPEAATSGAAARSTKTPAGATSAAFPAPPYASSPSSSLAHSHLFVDSRDASDSPACDTAGSDTRGADAWAEVEAGVPPRRPASPPSSTTTTATAVAAVASEGVPSPDAASPGPRSPFEVRVAPSDIAGGPPSAEPGVAPRAPSTGLQHLARFISAWLPRRGTADGEAASPDLSPRSTSRRRRLPPPITVRVRGGEDSIEGPATGAGDEPWCSRQTGGDVPSFGSSSSLSSPPSLLSADEVAALCAALDIPWSRGGDEAAPSAGGAERGPPSPWAGAGAGGRAAAASAPSPAPASLPRLDAAWTSPEAWAGPAPHPPTPRGAPLAPWAAPGACAPGGEDLPSLEALLRAIGSHDELARFLAATALEHAADARPQEFVRALLRTHDAPRALLRVLGGGGAGSFGAGADTRLGGAFGAERAGASPHACAGASPASSPPRSCGLATSSPSPQPDSLDGLSGPHVRGAGGARGESVAHAAGAGSGPDPATRRALAGAVRAAARWPAARRALVDAGAVRATCALLGARGGAARAAGARALANLVVGDARAKAEAGRRGAVGHLTAMAARGSPAACREAASAALGNLAAHSEPLATLLAQAGACVPLVHLLGGEAGAKARVHAARTLRNVAGRARGAAEALLAADAPAELVSLLASGIADGDATRAPPSDPSRSPFSDSAALAGAASALANLSSRGADARAAVRAAGAPRALLAAMRRPPSPEVAEACAWALANLAADEEGKGDVWRAAGRDGQLARLVADGLRSGDAGGSPRDEGGLGQPGSLRHGSARLARNLARGDANAANALVAAGCVESLVSMLSEEDGAESRPPSPAAAPPGATDAGHPVAGQRPAPAPAPPARVPGGLGACERAVCGALAALCDGSAEARRAAAAAGASARLARLIADPVAGEALCADAASALGAMALSRQSAAAVSSSPLAVPLLVSLLRGGRGDAARDAAAAALSRLAAHVRASAAAIADAGGASALAGLLDPAANAGDEAKEAAARTIRRMLAEAPELVDPAISRGSVPWLVALARGGRRDTEARGAPPRDHGHLDAPRGPTWGGGRDVPRAAAAGAAVHEDEDSAGGSAALAEAAPTPRHEPPPRPASPPPTLAREAARALGAIACLGDSAREDLVDRGAVGALVQLLASPADDVRAAAATALWDVLYDCEPARERALATGAVPWLTQLLLFGGPAAREAAAACLAELASHGPDAVRQILRSGALPLLRSLAACAIGRPAPSGAASAADSDPSADAAVAALEALRALEAAAGAFGVDPAEAARAVGASVDAFPGTSEGAEMAARRHRDEELRDSKRAEGARPPAGASELAPGGQPGRDDSFPFEPTPSLVGGGPRGEGPPSPASPRSFAQPQPDVPPSTDAGAGASLAVWEEAAGAGPAADPPTRQRPTPTGVPPLPALPRASSGGLGAAEGPSSPPSPRSSSPRAPAPLSRRGSATTTLGSRREVLSPGREAAVREAALRASSFVGVGALFPPTSSEVALAAELALDPAAEPSDVSSDANSAAPGTPGPPLAARPTSAGRRASATPLDAEAPTQAPLRSVSSSLLSTLARTEVL